MPSARPPPCWRLSDEESGTHDFRAADAAIAPLPRTSAITRTASAADRERQEEARQARQEAGSSVPMAAGARSRTSAAPRPGSLTRRAGDQSGPSCAVCYRVLSGIRLQNVYPYGDRLHRPTTSRPLRGGAGPPARRRSWLGPRPPARGRGPVGGRYGLHGLAVGGNRGAVSAADRGGVGKGRRYPTLATTDRSVDEALDGWRKLRRIRRQQ